MKAKLKRIEARAEALTSLFWAGRITEARYLADLRRLTDRAEEILARMG